MATAPPFPEPWGWNQLVGQNKTNILNASIEAWKNTGKEINLTTGKALSAEPGMGAMFVFGMLPFVFGTMIYIRTQKLMPTAFVMLLTTWGLHAFNLVADIFLVTLWTTSVIALGIAIYSAMWNKD